MTRQRLASPRAAAASGGRALALLRSCRPRQWLKNLLVLAAPAAAGVLFTWPGLAGSAVAFAAFCLAASGGYLLNDAADAAADRRHPVKRLRPVASGQLSTRLARAAGLLLLALAPALAALTGSWRLPLVVAGYLALTLAYTWWLKHQPVVDLVAVAACHVIRAYAGAVAVAVPVTSWFLVVVSLGSLLLVAGKREVELRAAHGAGRATLDVYTPAYLAHVRTMASGAMIVTYCLWALETRQGAAHGYYAVSIVPFVLLILRHNLLVERGIGEEPEELALRDRPLQLFLGLFLLPLAAGIVVE